MASYKHGDQVAVRRDGKLIAGRFIGACRPILGDAKGLTVYIIQTEDTLLWTCLETDLYVPEGKRLPPLSKDPPG